MEQNNKNRRSFLKSTGTAIVAGTVLPFGFNIRDGFAGQKAKLKVGLIGCGGRGTGAAAQALKADKDAELTAMGDIFSDYLEESYQSLKKINPEQVKVDEAHKFIGFDAIQQVIDSGVDVVILTTPPAFRPSHFKAAVEAGKHVFCEKPVAVDAPGVRSVLESARMAKEKGLSVVSGFTFRYDFPKRAIFERIKGGEIGEITDVFTARNGGGLWYKERQDSWTEMEYQLRNWYYYDWLSGDYIVEMMVHSLDLMSWAFGDRLPIQVTATGGRQARTEEKWGNIYDHFAVEYEYENNLKGVHFSRQQKGCSNTNKVNITGTEGFATIDVGKRVHATMGSERWDYDGPSNNPYETQHEELFASIRSGEAMNEGELMANSTMLAIIGRMAGYSGQTITWEEAMKSEVKLGPAAADYRWDLVVDVPQVAIPGITKAV
ncbi:Gfo/Idh/MocA family protein [Cyclobacterium marinum]|uniref:Oxidoreductase domain protein n=1 Tax=Cyclobacterium marinum (strain ATCC 25205 / DSM 745 / LMG 13164 / NCIMB 1802) TaxID=880070 RepID=G0J7Q6_CYCMS|nr:Gfo/Idh/MocA family oxidoreductase [Cyclobacterium marinum]AEL27754.1 oxidoreductase domain protein [Cyclobacterium marinum DSM 745]MBR9777116.1 Gfo/Idh/MocA family oxidoreductase [Cytophagales bacterium]|tara:strand:- start:40130 stop:41428 length:1299 start_codon:yes stop_codon:yes gene_type:complete